MEKDGDENAMSVDLEHLEENQVIHLLNNIYNMKFILYYHIIIFMLFVNISIIGNNS